MREPRPTLASDLTFILDRFEQAWEAGSPPDLTAFVGTQSKSDSATERTVLAELAAIDLEHRWRSVCQGLLEPEKAWRLEDYVAAFPELGPLGQIPLQLICEEYRARHRWGDQPGHDEYLDRFPEPAGELASAIEDIDRELAAEALVTTDREPTKKRGSRSESTPFATLDSLLDDLVESGLMSHEEVADFLDTQYGSEKSPTAEQLARQLVKQGRLTEFQARMIYHGRGDRLQLGNYVILDQLGSGGMGRVYKGKHAKMDRPVVIKVMSRALSNDAEAVKRFRRESRALSKLSHPNVITAFDAGEYRGLHFLVTEYVGGKDLATIVSDHGPLDIETALNYLLQAARGLEYTHSRGIVHRDVKPSNLLVASDGHIKLLDLGLASVQQESVALADRSNLTRTGAVMGTLDYLAPEQAADSKRANATSDLYSLGCTFYFLLTGRPIYHADTLVQKILAHREQPIPSLQQHSDVSEKLDALFQRMVAKQSEDRPATMTDLIAELEEIGLKSSIPLEAATPAPATVALRSPLEATVVNQTESPTPLARVWLVALGAPFMLAAVCGFLAYRHWTQPEKTKVVESNVVTTTGSPAAVPAIKVVPSPILNDSHALEGDDAHAAPIDPDNHEMDEGVAKSELDRAVELIAHLVEAPLEDVDDIAKELGKADQAVIRPALQEAFVRGGSGSRQRMNCALVLLNTDPSQLETVYHSILEVRASELIALLDLLQSHRDQLVVRLWDDVKSDRLSAAQQLRGYSALACYDPGSEDWINASEQAVAAVFAREEEAGEWTNKLANVGDPVCHAAIKAFLHSRESGDLLREQGKTMAALLGDRRDFLVRAVPLANQSQLSVLVDLLRSSAPSLSEQLVEELRSTLEKGDELADIQRSANVVAALLQLGLGESISASLARTDAVPIRTFLTHHLAGLGVRPQHIVEQLRNEKNPRLRRCLLLSLGIGSDAYSVADRQLVLETARMSFTDARYVVEHSAAAWVLRQLDDDDWLTVTLRKLGGEPIVAERDWYVSKLGLTMAIFDDEASGVKSKSRIAMATVESPGFLFKAFRDANPDFKIERRQSLPGQSFAFSSGDKVEKTSSDGSLPQTNVSWFEAAAFCRWLSEQEGIRESAMCYPALEKFKPAIQFRFGETFPFPFSDRMKQFKEAMKQNTTTSGELKNHVVVSVSSAFASRGGYRLPTVSEWKLVADSDCPSSISHMNLLPQYVWFRGNSMGRLQPVGRLMPSVNGIFDLRGNAAEWCFDADKDEANPFRIRYGSKRRVSGGSISTSIEQLETAQAMPASTKGTIGFRVVRTLSAKK